MTVPYTFANAVGLVPASELDVNFDYVSNNVSTANTVVANAQPNITSVGTLTSLSTSGNIRGGNLLTAGTISATGTITTAGNLSLTGNIVDLGELWINTLSNGNINLNVNGTGNVNIPTGLLSVTGNIQGGNLRTAGLISATANITGGNVLTGGLISATANVTGGNVLTGGLISATANITGGNLSGINIEGTLTTASQTNITSVGILDSLSATGNIRTGSFVSATGNVTGGNVRTVGFVSATGNITGNYFIGNGSQLTGISSGVQSSIANGISNVEIASANGNATITANAATYTFGTNSTLTLPGGSQLSPLGANLDIFAGTGAYVNLTTSDESSRMGVDNGGGYVTTAGGTWDFDTAGNLTAPGNISAVGTVTGNNISAVTAFQLPVYANTTTRDTAISSPIVGMLIVVGNTYQGYNGASWGNITLT